MVNIRIYCWENHGTKWWMFQLWSWWHQGTRLQFHIGEGRIPLVTDSFHPFASNVWVERQTLRMLAHLVLVVLLIILTFSGTPRGLVINSFDQLTSIETTSCVCSLWWLAGSDLELCACIFRYSPNREWGAKELQSAFPNHTIVFVAKDLIQSK